eukprot:Tamp_20670.p1 GENE.Tamp_20670~~Tamp_20670.p1  ORF type:complete len:377 (-),score=50.87 Tamp_20670:56-1036(-)
MLAAALPGSLAFDIIAALGAACRESLRRGVPLDEMAARASLLTRALAAVSGSWEQLSEEQAEAFVGELCHLAQPSLQRAETGTAAAGPSVLALMGLVDPAGTWARALARLGMRHALLPALLDRSILEEYLALLLPLPSFLLSHLSVCSSDAQERDVSGGDWRLLEASQILLILQHLFQAQEIIAMLPSTSAERRTHPPTAAASSLHHPQPTTRDSRILTFAGHVPALADVARALKEVMSACVAEASVPRGRTLLAQVQCFLYFSQCIVIFRPVHGACSNVFMYSSEISNPPKYFSLLALSDSNCDFEIAVCAILKWPYVTVVASCF